MHNEDGVIVYSTNEPTITQEQWNTLHEMLSSETVEEIADNFTYYFKEYCYFPGSRFCFNMNFVYFNRTPRPIDKVHSEETFFQQSTVYDFHDLSFNEIMKLKQIYEFIIGEFP